MGESCWQWSEEKSLSIEPWWDHYQPYWGCYQLHPSLQVLCTVYLKILLSYLFFVTFWALSYGPDLPHLLQQPPSLCWSPFLACMCFMDGMDLYQVLPWGTQNTWNHSMNHIQEGSTGSNTGSQVKGLACWISITVTEFKNQLRREVYIGHWGFLWLAVSFVVLVFHHSAPVFLVVGT